MALPFLDTSTLVRPYDRTESGARAVRPACAPSTGHTVVIARIASVEMASALGRKTRDGALSLGDAGRLFQDLWRHDYQVLALTDAIYARAERLLFTHPLRSYDALQLGCALGVASHPQQTGLEFWTADQRQALDAATEGLVVHLVV